MTIFTVHLPRPAYSASGTETSDLAKAVFVPEKFSWPAFIFGPLWLIARGLWLALVVWLAAIFVLIMAAASFLSAGAVFWIFVAIEFLLGLEGNRMRRGKLARRGYRLVDIVDGRRRDEAEKGFFTSWLARPPASPAPLRSPIAAMPSVHGEEVLGHFPLPGGHE